MYKALSGKKARMLYHEQKVIVKHGEKDYIKDC